MRTFEDFAVGQHYDLGTLTVTADEIIEFATRYDPQPFHTDPEAARQSHFGGLIASGWHTAALFMRLYVDGLLTGSASLGSPGVEELRWLHPVRPGDTLTGVVTVLDTWVSQNNPARGTVVLRCEFVNAEEVEVMRFRARGMFARRAAG